MHHFSNESEASVAENYDKESLAFRLAPLTMRSMFIKPNQDLGSSIRSVDPRRFKSTFNVLRDDEHFYPMTKLGGFTSKVAE